MDSTCMIAAAECFPVVIRRKSCSAPSPSPQINTRDMRPKLQSQVPFRKGIRFPKTPIRDNA